MGQKEKLIERLKAKPKTFTFDDAESLLRYFHYERSNKAVPAVHESCLCLMNIPQS